MKLVGDDGAEIQLEHVSVVGLLPTDVVVVKVALVLDYIHSDRLMAMVQRVFPDNKVLLLQAEANIEIVRETP